MESIQSVSPSNVVIDVKYGYFGVLSSVIFFQILHKCVCRYGTPKSVVGWEAQWKWNNLVISWMHAILCGIWSLSCFYICPNMVNELVYGVSVYKFCLISMSTGYFIHDCIDIFTGVGVRTFWEVVVHHIVIISTCSYHLTHNFLLGWTVVALLSEVNTIFLHTRKLLQLCHVPYDHWTYRASVWLNLVTFVIFRFGSNFWVLRGLASSYHVLPFYYAFGLFLPCWIVLFVINPILFWRLLKSDWLRPTKSAEVIVNGTNNNINCEASKKCLNGTVGNSGKKHS